MTPPDVETVETVPTDDVGDELPAETDDPTSEEKNRNDLKATKSDDAAVPVWLWNDAVREDLENDPIERGHSLGDIDNALDRIRTFLLAWKLKLGVTSSFLGYVRTTYPNLEEQRPDRPAVEWKEANSKYVWCSCGHNLVGKKAYQGWWTSFWDVAAAEKFGGRDAVGRAADSSWWDWDTGSAPIYWRWPEEYRTVVRDGLEIWFSGEKPKWRQVQKKERDKVTRQRVITKLDKARKRKYISPGTVTSLTDFSAYPRGWMTSVWSTTERPVVSTISCGSQASRCPPVKPSSELCSHTLGWTIPTWASSS
jgi:hypothetical protein